MDRSNRSRMVAASMRRGAQFRDKAAGSRPVADAKHNPDLHLP